ncbi:MAG TPA: hypothetical protein VHG51_03725 [Longimicrobiaceae bacterium]|nr:hypothetical protein [Longimicrobiaceae bacterium]
MKNRLPKLLGTVVVGALAAAGCSDGTPTGVQAVPDGSPRAAVIETCEVINFDQFGMGDAVTAVSLPTLGLDLTVTTTRWVNPGGFHGGIVSARAFETDGLDDDPAGPGSVVVEDDDLQWRGEEAPGESDGGGECAGCAGLGRVLVIPDQRDFIPWGDYVFGGSLSFSGDFSGGGYYLKSYVAVDVDATSPGIKAIVDGVQVAQSTNLGNGSVHTVNVVGTTQIDSAFAFVLGTPARDNTLGSGAIDGIQICRQVEEQEEPGGDEGCTLGYWKQQHHHDSWTTYTPAQDLNTVFDFTGDASAFASLGDDSFLEALNYKGGSGELAAARLLLKQAVAALLNAASPDVDYALTTAQVVAQVDAALDTRDRGTMLALAGQLDANNNAGCPLN